MTHLTDLLAAVARGDDPGPFALLRREGADHVELFTGPVDAVDRLADLPLPAGRPRPADAGPGAVPADRRTRLRLRRRRRPAGVPASHREHRRIPLADVLAALPDEPVGTGDAGVRRRRRGVRADRRAGAGRGDRPGRGRQLRHPPHPARHRAGCPAGARRWPRCAGCCVAERGAYWTFLVHTGTRTLVGATPERHVSVDDGLVDDEPDQRHVPAPGGGRRPGGAAAVPRRPEGGRGAVHGARRGAEDDGHRRRARRPGGRPVPQGDGAPGAHRVPAGRAGHPGRARGAARDDVRAHRDRQPDGERLPGDRPPRAPGPGLLRRACWPCSATTTRAGRRWTRRS